MGRRRLRADPVAHHGRGPVSVTLGLTFDADFADIFEVQGMRRGMRGRRHRPSKYRSNSGFDYEGRDGVRRTTRIVCSVAPRWPRGRLRFAVNLEEHGV